MGLGAGGWVGFFIRGHEGFMRGPEGMLSMKATCQ